MTAAKPTTSKLILDGSTAGRALLTADDVAAQKAILAIPYYIEVALSANATAISSGTFKGFARVHTDGTITGFVIDCDPNNEPSAAAVQVDLNTVNRSTGTATSVLSAVASIATSANTGTGTISGSPSVSAGDLLSFDIDQGSDGKDLIATVEITPS